MLSIYIETGCPNIKRQTSKIELQRPQINNANKLSNVDPAEIPLARDKGLRIDSVINDQSHVNDQSLQLKAFIF